MLLSSACVYKQSEDPLIVDAISDTVKRHPNLTEVTVSEEKFGSRSLSIGVVKGVLQKADVRKVELMMYRRLSLDLLKTPWPLSNGSKTSDAMGPNCECMHAGQCIVMLWFHFQHLIVSMRVHSATKGDLVQEHLIPAMKAGSLKILGVTLEDSSSVESILRELPHARVEELAIGLDTYPSEAVS